MVHESIVRKVFFVPANGDEPHVTSMSFSEEGARYSRSFYNIAVELWSLYGDLGYQVRTYKVSVDGEDYIVYRNVGRSTKLLPINKAWMRILGYDPQNPPADLHTFGSGDLVVVRVRQQVNNVENGEVDEQDIEYLDVSDGPEMRHSLEESLRHSYTFKLAMSEHIEEE